MAENCIFGKKEKHPLRRGGEGARGVILNRGLLGADEALGRFGGCGAVGSLATGAAPRVVAVIPVAEAPTVAVVVWTIYAVELEV